MNAIQSLSSKWRPSYLQAIQFSAITQWDKRIVAVALVAFCCLAVAFLYFKDYFFKATLNNKKSPQVKLSIGEPDSNGFYVLPDRNVYKGDILDGKPHGQGELLYRTSGKYMYEGQFANGLPNGQGILYYTAKFGRFEKYEGEFIDGEPSGKGTYCDRERNYVGEIVNGKMHGKGTLTSIAGYGYENGERKTYYGNVYVGDFFEDKKQGHGFYTFKKGKYEGEFNDDMMHGKGTLIDLDGEKYEGEFVCGMFWGQGVLTYPNGDKFEGTFVEARESGKGTFTFANGEKYEGDFKEGQITGNGVFTSSDGEKFEGHYEEGLRQGPASKIGPDGTQLVGDWTAGKSLAFEPWISRRSLL